MDAFGSDLHPSGDLQKTTMAQLQHANWHGWTAHHWHVGVTALDGPRHRTEHIESLLGYPVVRDCNMARDSIQLIPEEGRSCHEHPGR